MRVLWLTTGLGRGGVERLLVDTARRIDRTRFEVTIAYVLPWKDALADEAADAGAAVTCIGVGRPPIDPRWIGRLRRLLHDDPFDIVHTHAPLPAAAARLLAPGSTAFVHTEHNLWPRYRGPTRALNAITWRRNGHAFAVSASVASSVRPRWRRAAPEVEVALQGLDLTRFSGGPDARTEARGRLGIAGDAVVVGTVGNLVAKKDHATLVRAVAGLGAHVHLVIVGTGPLADSLDSLAASMSVTLHLIGARADVPALLPGFDVFCLSSRFEGLPIALLEAMASGVPIVASDVGGVGEVVTHGVDGLLVPSGDPLALASALHKVLDDSAMSETMVVAGRRRVAEFDLDRPVARTMAVYEELTR